MTSLCPEPPNFRILLTCPKATQQPEPTCLLASVARVTPVGRVRADSRAQSIFGGNRQPASLSGSADLRDQFANADERRYDMDMDMAVALASWPIGPPSGKGVMFVATIRMAYRVEPVGPVLRFACVSDLDEDRELLHDQTCMLVHYFQPVAELELHGASEEAFELVKVAVDGHVRSAGRMVHTGTQVHTVSVGTQAMARKTVTIAYTYRVPLQRHSHLLHLDFPRATKGLTVHLNHDGQCGIRRVTMVDYMPCSRVSSDEVALGLVTGGQAALVSGDVGLGLARSGVTPVGRRRGACGQVLFRRPPVRTGLAPFDASGSPAVVTCRSRLASACRVHAGFPLPFRRSALRIPPASGHPSTAWPPSPCGRLSRPPWRGVTPATTTGPLSPWDSRPVGDPAFVPVIRASAT